MGVAAAPSALRVHSRSLERRGPYPPGRPAGLGWALGGVSRLWYMLFYKKILAAGSFIDRKIYSDRGYGLPS
jgi:hypothetical protein